MDTLIAEIIKVMASVVLGASIPIVGTWLNNRHIRQLQIQQWKREDEREEKEATRRHLEKLAEQRQRDYQEIISSYANAARHLMVADISSSKNELGEMQPYLLQILQNYPDKETPLYRNFRSAVNRLVDNIVFNPQNNRFDDVRNELVRYVYQLQENDSRLKSSPA